MKKFLKEVALGILDHPLIILYVGAEDEISKPPGGKAKPLAKARPTPNTTRDSAWALPRPAPA